MFVNKNYLYVFHEYPVIFLFVVLTLLLLFQKADKLSNIGTILWLVFI